MDRADKQWHAVQVKKPPDPSPPAAPKVKSASRRPKAGAVALPPIGKNGPGSARPPDTGATTTVGGPTPRQEFSDRSSLQPSAPSATSSAKPSPRPGASVVLEVSRMRQELVRQFGSVHKALGNLMPNPRRITPADLASAMRRIDHCSEDEAHRIFQRLDVKLRGVLTAEEIEGQERETAGRFGGPSPGHEIPGLLNLAQGNEEVIRRVSDLAEKNAELKRQLSIQADEVISLEVDSRKQRDLFLEHEHRVEEQLEKVRLETLAEAREREKHAVEEAKKEAAEEFKQQVREAEEARKEAQVQVAILQEKLEESKKRGPRVEAAEMELRLIRERLDRENEGRLIAEDKVKESETRYSQLEIRMGKLQRENDALHRKLEEQVELANFHQEISGDLQGRMDDVAALAEMRVRKEKGRKEAIQRLEGILPRNILMKAMN